MEMAFYMLVIAILTFAAFADLPHHQTDGAPYEGIITGPIYRHILRTCPPSQYM